MKFFGKKSIIGIELHDYSAQVVEIKSVGGENHLEAYNRILLPPKIIENGEIKDSEELKKRLKILLNNANPRSITCKNIAVVFPSTKLFPHIFKFPKNLSKEEICESLPYEAEKVIPFSINDVYWDFNRLPDKESVLFVAIEKQTADKYVELLQSMGLTSLLFGTDVETLQHGLKSQIDAQKNSLIIEIGTLASNYLIVKDGFVKKFTSSNKGGKQFVSSLSEEFGESEKEILSEKETDKLKEKHHGRIKEFMDMNYEIAREMAEEYRVRDVYLTGEFLNLPGFYEFGRNHFPDSNIYIGDPKKTLRIEAKRFKSIEEGENSSYYSTHFTNAVGIAIQAMEKRGKEGINILPEGLKENERSRKRNLIISISSIAMTAVLLFLATFIFFKHQEMVYRMNLMNIEKTSIDRMLYGTRYQEILGAIRKFNREVDDIHRIETALFSMPGLLDSVTALLNRNITLNRFRFSDSDMTVEIGGVAANRESLLAAVQRFKDAEFVSEVTTPLSSYDLREDISFTMRIKLIFKELKPYGSNTDA